MCFCVVLVQKKTEGNFLHEIDLGSFVGKPKLFRNLLVHSSLTHTSNTNSKPRNIYIFNFLVFAFALAFLTCQSVKMQTQDFNLHCVACVNWGLTMAPHLTTTSSTIVIYIPCRHQINLYDHCRHYLYYNTQYKIYRFWLFERSTINP